PPPLSTLFPYTTLFRSEVYVGIGATVKEISLPHSPYSVAAYYLVATAEASSNLARYDGVHFGHRAANYNGLLDMVCKSRGEGFGDRKSTRLNSSHQIIS